MNTLGAKALRASLLLIFILLSSTLTFSETLWSPAFNGYISGIPTFDIGDIVHVVIDTESSLQYKSSRVDSENVILEFSGGQSEGLFSFLPDAKSSGTVDLQGEESVAITMSLAARIVERDDAGALRLQGRQSVVVSGAEQALEVDGWVYPSAIGRGMAVNISRLADMSLKYTALVDGARGVLSSDDIVYRELDTVPVAESGLPAEEGGTLEEPAPLALDGAELDGTTESGGDLPAANQIETPQKPQIVPTLDDAKVEELLLRYINRFLDWVF